MTSVHAQLGELDEPLSWGSRALALAHRLGNLELRILTTTYLDSLSAWALAELGAADPKTVRLLRVRTT